MTKQGKLRIYFGYVAGVGKTYAMLEGAHEALKNGVDVVAGYIEPHPRPETSALIKGLEVLPTKKLIYKGIKLTEFDLDAALERRPQLILVDELAHTNSYGSRNKKRYQDVAELLKAGIDVYTTINVQHIESLNDVVEKITGIHVNERIPDEVFDQADQIELVDTDPLNLLDRLNKGKIYKKDQAQRALQNFFTEEKLIALREIALRKTADQVNSRAVSSDKGKNSSYTKEHILVCLSPSSAASNVIRAASRLAVAFKADFTALYVGDLDDDSVTTEDKVRLRQNQRLAEQLGAKLSVIYGDDLAKQIAEYAKASHVSKVVIGKTPEKLGWRRTSIVDEINHLAPNLDIYIIPSETKAEKMTSRSRRPFNLSDFRFQLNLSDVLKMIFMLVLVTVISLGFRYLNLNVSNIVILYILGVQITAVITRGWVPSVIAAFISVFAFNFFFTAPYYTFEAFDSTYPMIFVSMVVAGLITVSLINRTQRQAKVYAEKSYRTEILLETNKELQDSNSELEILDATAHQLERLLERDILIYPVKDGLLQEVRYFSTVHSSITKSIYQSYQEEGVANWVLHNNKRAGATTNTLTASKYLYFAVRRKGQVFAVVGILMENSPELDTFEKSIVYAIFGEAALAMEKESLTEEQQKIELKMQQEQLRSNLLRAISHDLRTPLASISGNAKLLLESGGELDKKQHEELASYIYDDSMWLINMVENLLSITKLDEDVQLNMSTNVVDEIIEEAVKHVDRHVSQHELELDLSSEILMAKMDAPLMIQVMINLINNAVKYTPVGSKIAVQTRRVEGDKIQVEVADNGPGIPDQVKNKIFDLFYTTGNKRVDASRGLGLGLSLCRSIINAHKGEIYVRDNAPQGVVIGFTLPAVEVDLGE